MRTGETRAEHRRRVANCFRAWSCHSLWSMQQQRIVCYRIIDPNNRKVADTICGGEEDKANAEFIVGACNARLGRPCDATA